MVSWLDERPMGHAEAGGQGQSLSAVLLDSQPIMLEILARYLEPAGVATVSKQTRAAGALNAVREHRPDLLLIDLQDLEGVATIVEARALDPDMRTVVLVDPGADEVFTAAGAAGATIVISRAASREDLAVAVRRAFGGSNGRKETSRDRMYQPARSRLFHT